MQTILGTTVLGGRTFRTGDDIVVKEMHGEGTRQVKVDVFTRPEYLVIRDTWGNVWCIHNPNHIL